MSAHQILDIGRCSSLLMLHQINFFMFFLLYRAIIMSSLLHKVWRIRCVHLRHHFISSSTTTSCLTHFFIFHPVQKVRNYWKDGYALWGDCFIFVYSITDRASFQEATQFKRQVEAVRKSTSITCALVANKNDLLHDRQVHLNYSC